MEPGEMELPDLEVTRLDGSPKRQSKPAGMARWARTRTGRAAFSAVCALLVVVALVGLTMRATPDPAGAIKAALGLPTATSTAPILFGGDTFLITNIVPWGELTVDGRHPELTDIGDLGTGFSLQRGVHHLVYQAQDFPTLRCVISVPESAHDTCPKATDVPQAASASFQRFLNLRASPARLLPAAYQSLIAAIDAQLATISATTTIQPGERYYTQTGALATARAPMSFTMGLKPNHMTMQDCQTIVCELGDGVGFPAGWQLETLATPTWTITDPTGKTFTSAIPSAQTFGNAIAFNAVPTYSGWDAQIDRPGPLGDVMDSAATATLEANWSEIGQETGLGFGRLASPADGVVLEILSSGATVPSGTPSTTPVQAGEAEVLWRFGILLAVSDMAQRQFPGMPVASPAERMLARTAIYLRY